MRARLSRSARSSRWRCSVSSSGMDHHAHPIMMKKISIRPMTVFLSKSDSFSVHTSCSVASRLSFCSDLLEEGPDAFNQCDHLCRESLPGNVGCSRHEDTMEAECFRLEQIAKQMLIDPPRLPHPPFDTVSLDGSAKFFFSNETDKTALVRIFVDPVSKLNGRGSLNLCFPAEEPVKIVSPAQNPAAGKGQFFLLLIR